MGVARTASAKNRVSILETLTRVVPVVTRNTPGAPDPGVLRRALRQEPEPGRARRPAPDQAEAGALAWLEKSSRPVSALEDDAVVCDVLDALAVNLDGPRPRRRGTSRGAAGCCTRCSATRCARSGWTRTRSAKATYPRAGRHRRHQTPWSTRGASAPPR